MAYLEVGPSAGCRSRVEPSQGYSGTPSCDYTPSDKIIGEIHFKAFRDLLKEASGDLLTYPIVVALLCTLLLQPVN